MDLGLNGKRVLVTGSTRGIGFAIAQGFLHEGANVVITSRDKSGLKKAKLVMEKQFSGNRFMTTRCDFRSPSDINAARVNILKKWDGLDILIANVGSGLSIPEPIPPSDHFDAVFNENFSVAVNSARIFLPDIIESKGNIIFISSIAGIEAFGAPTDYSVAKTAVLAFSKNLARKVAKEGIRVNCIAPGNVYFKGGSWDEKLIENPEGVKNIIENDVPMKRFGRPDEIADAVVFLASQRASFITGSVLFVDGGQTVTLF